MHQELSGECDNFDSLQYPIAPTRNLGAQIDTLFNYCNSDDDQCMKMWRQVQNKDISNRSKLPK